MFLGAPSKSRFTSIVPEGIQEKSDGHFGIPVVVTGTGDNFLGARGVDNRPRSIAESRRASSVGLSSSRAATTNRRLSTFSRSGESDEEIQNDRLQALVAKTKYASSAMLGGHASVKGSFKGSTNERKPSAVQILFSQELPVVQAMRVSRCFL
jgi:hypothetical protein